MSEWVELYDLGPDEFAFHFEGRGGVDADALATFLKRASAIAKRQDGVLQVVGLREGSLAVIIKAVRRSKAGEGAAKEFSEKPIDTTIKVSGFVASIIAALVYAMSPEQSGPTPISKAGADLIYNKDVNQILIVSQKEVSIVMNSEIAAEVRRLEVSRERRVPQVVKNIEMPPSKSILAERAQHGILSGDVETVGGRLHFRPDGYRYWVPVDESNLKQLPRGGRFRIRGRITTRAGQPDHIVVDWATPMEQ